MDLIDASNEPTPITKDPLTGNTIHPAPTQAIEDTPMDDGEIPNNNLPTTILDNRPTSYDFDTSPTEIKNKIVLLRTSISAAWGLLSPASAFPMQYLPDPDTHNWGLSLLTVLNQLAQMTQGKWKNDAIWHIIRHIKERNEVHGDTEDKDITPAQIIKGDFVLRVEDVEYAIWKLRPKVDASFGGRGGRGGRGNLRGGGRGGRRQS